jgi:hypothetical protein
MLASSFKKASSAVGHFNRTTGTASFPRAALKASEAGDTGAILSAFVQAERASQSRDSGKTGTSFLEQLRSLPYRLFRR